MKVSIITAVFNNKVSIAQCIDSIISQTYSNIELIIIDGGSNDGTLEILSKYKDKINTLLSESDRGIYDALNKGVTLATGDIIGFLHSDDTFHNADVLKNIVESFANNKVDGVYGNLLYIDKKDPEKIIRNWQSKQYNRTLLRQGWMPPHPTLFLKREVYNEIGLFNLTYKISADYDFMVRVLNSEKYNIKFMPIYITCMKVGGASNKSLKNIIRKSSEDYKIMHSNRIGGFFTLFKKNFSKLGQFF
jgi:glycosyltransferase